ncbi:unnamed protein product [Schistosoma margrebowiei]|uniref:Uncharacterized protein n=1 Tax=Schistosoma margrebowiei TaxID=48269 RepID=A0A183MGZ4_9TREM|nr:unnamed protein product [Schistosoma margrebowiei]
MEEMATTAGKDKSEGSMRQIYDTTKKLTGEYSKPERPVKDKECKPVTEIQEHRDRSIGRFEELSNIPAPLNPPDIEAAPTDVTISTVEEIKSGEAAEPDNLPAESLKSNIEIRNISFPKLTTKMKRKE